MLDLNNLIPKNSFTLVSAQGIDDQGRIIVDGIDTSGNYHALLLTESVPEPSSWIVLASSGVALILYRRRRGRDIVT